MVVEVMGAVEAMQAAVLLEAASEGEVLAVLEVTAAALLVVTMAAEAMAGALVAATMAWDASELVTLGAGTGVPAITVDGIITDITMGIPDSVFSWDRLFSGRLTITGLIIPTRRITLHRPLQYPGLPRFISNKELHREFNPWRPTPGTTAQTQKVIIRT